jgi:3-oxoacyl-[acyl-carrier protein] reductase
LSVNLKGAFNLTRHASSPMQKKRSGRIVMVSSVIGLMGNSGQANYAASKAGLIGLAKSVAKELAARNITCNLVAPGYIATDMTASLPEDVKAEMIKRIPAGRYGTAEDVAGVIAFLCSDAAQYVTGEVIRVDGGMAM